MSKKDREQEAGTNAPWRAWGKVGDDFDQASVDQIRRACSLPVSVAGALMPDAHVGYGLPIGGVLATVGAVVPYAVGVDIACRMKLSVLDIPVAALKSEHERRRLARAIEQETRFGVGASFTRPNDHEVMDRDWDVSPVTRALKDKAWSQLGTSGSGNHFVEWGTLTIEGEGLGLQGGQYLALLSHSGSRGTGAAVCDRYSKAAMEQHKDLPPDLRQLAWLGLETPEGREYWAAMELMGHYASANHAVIHRRITEHLGAEVIGGVENHHNFAWKERHVIGGVEQDVIVHRKGATPAGKGVLGMIPGSMASPGFVVRGRGCAESLNSAAHGAGRVMSRTQARKTFAWGNVRREIEAKGITVLSAGIDEVPGVYKDIERVMARQEELVEIVARFDPSIVKMAPEGEKAED
ncbi:MAG: RtcB family protein [Phycisphaerales bacterium]|nr:RtcB family protein [Phycisphaerales bacterium]